MPPVKSFRKIGDLGNYTGLAHLSLWRLPGAVAAGGSVIFPGAFFVGRTGWSDNVWFDSLFLKERNQDSETATGTTVCTGMMDKENFQ